MKLWMIILSNVSDVFHQILEINGCFLLNLMCCLQHVWLDNFAKGHQDVILQDILQGIIS